MSGVSGQGPYGAQGNDRGGPANSRFAAGFDPQRIWQLVRRRRFYLVLPFLVIGVFVGAGLPTITPVFTCTSKILVESKGTSIGADIDRRLWTLEGERVLDRNRLSVTRETLRSEELLLKVIRALRLREDPLVIAEARHLQLERLPEQTVTIIAERILVNRLRQKIWVDGVGANVFMIHIQDNEPVTAFRLNEAITRAYIDQMERNRLERQIESLNFTDEEFEQSRLEFQSAEEDLNVFKRSMIRDRELDGNPIDPDNARTAENILRLVRLDLAELNGDFESAVARLRGQGADGRPLTLIIDNSEIRVLSERIRALEREDFLGRLQDSATPGSRRNAMSAERQRIGVQRNRLAERVTQFVDEAFSGSNPTLREDIARLHELTVVLSVLEAHESQITTEYQAYTTRVQEQPAQEAELRRLENSVDRAENIFESLVNARMAGETTQRAQAFGFGTRIRVIEPAKKPLAPSSPNKTKIAMVAAVLALGIGFGAVFMAEYVDSSFKDVAELESTMGLEVLGTLPRFGKDMQWEKEKRRRGTLWRLAFAVTVISMILVLLVYYQRNSVADRINLVNPSSLTIGGE